MHCTSAAVTRIADSPGPISHAATTSEGATRSGYSRRLDRGVWSRPTPRTIRSFEGPPFSPSSPAVLFLCMQLAGFLGWRT
jgi:hypothetical protein